MNTYFPRTLKLKCSSVLNHIQHLLKAYNIKWKMAEKCKDPIMIMPKWSAWKLSNEGAKNSTQQQESVAKNVPEYPKVIKQT